MSSCSKNIILVGLMGCGKSSAGLKAAEIDGRKFIETDNEAERLFNKNIEDIFAEYGEEYFRDVESQVCRVAGKSSGAVISTGGGVVKRNENIEALRENGVIIYLDAAPSHIYNNLKGDNSRPLLANKDGPDKLKEIERLLSQRKELYEEYADIIINVNGKAIEQTAREILNKFHDFIGGNQ